MTSTSDRSLPNMRPAGTKFTGICLMVATVTICFWFRNSNDSHVLSAMTWMRNVVPLEHSDYAQTAQQVPEYLREAFILTGYRRAGMDFVQCLWSLLVLHNETVNMWTHLLSAMVFWGRSLLVLNRKKTDESSPTLAWFCASQAIVFTASFLAHTFSPAMQTEEQYLSLWKLDWSMIAVAMLGVAFLLVHCVFQRQHDDNHKVRRRYWRLCFAGSTGIMFVVVNTKAFTRLPPCFKAIGALIPIPCLVLFSLDVFLWQLPKSMATRFFLEILLGPLLLAVVGLAIYAVQVPERWLPGYFDLTGGSHTIHHLWTTTFSVWMLHNAQEWLRSSCFVGNKEMSSSNTGTIIIGQEEAASPFRVSSAPRAHNGECSQRASLKNLSQGQLMDSDATFV